ncbi:MAG: hypothetical protein U1E30_03105 [Rhodoblastus sp.]
MLPPFWRVVSLFNPVVYLISGFRWSFHGTGDVSLAASLGLRMGVIALPGPADLDFPDGVSAEAVAVIARSRRRRSNPSSFLDPVAGMDCRVALRVPRNDGLVPAVSTRRIRAAPAHRQCANHIKKSLYVYCAISRRLLGRPFQPAISRAGKLSNDQAFQ